MILILIFIFGLLVGSFLNAAIFRLYSEESIVLERSHCVHCKHKLSALDLIPVLSFVFLRGRCRYCSKKISWQYPLIELTTGAIFVLLAMNFSIGADFSSQFLTSNFHFLVSLIFVCFLIVIGIFDFKHYLILDKIVLPAFVLSLIYNIYTGELVQGLLAAAIISGFFLLQYLVSKGKWIGLGDVKLGLFLGSLLKLKLGLAMLMLAYFSGAVVGVGLIMAGKKKFSSQLPFGLFLCFSAIIIMLYGASLTAWYLKLIGL